MKSESWATVMKSSWATMVKIYVLGYCSEEASLGLLWSWATVAKRKRRVLGYCGEEEEASLGLLWRRGESWATVAKRRVLGYCGEEASAERVGGGVFQFCEDQIYRHLEPGLAFQLEINRLRNFDLVNMPTANYKMHLYLGKAKVAKGQEVTDYRFFVRAIVRHSDLITKVSVGGCGKFFFFLFLSRVTPEEKDIGAWVGLGFGWNERVFQ